MTASTPSGVGRLGTRSCCAPPQCPSHALDRRSDMLKSFIPIAAETGKPAAANHNSGE